MSALKQTLAVPEVSALVDWWDSVTCSNPVISYIVDLHMLISYRYD